MKHFEKLQEGIDVSPFIDEIAAHPHIFDADDSRQQGIPVQRETQAALLFGVDVEGLDRAQLDYAFLDTQARIGMPVRYRGTPTPEGKLLPKCSQFVRDLCVDMNGVPGRAVIARLRPGGRIYKHKDDQLYWLLRDRYHLVVQCGTGGSHFKCGDEEAYMQQGELWWFDPTVYHEAENTTDRDRIHFVMDVFSPHSMGSYLVRVKRAPLRTAYRSVRSLFKSFRPPRPPSTETAPV